MNIVMLGPPGSGKGTQALSLHKSLDVPIVSTGEILRSEVALGSDIGRLVQHALASGGYVPDSVVDALVSDRLSREECIRGFILDGYPRTVAQAHALDATLERTSDRVDAVIYLHVDREEVIRRLELRRTIEGRDDDAPETILRRLDAYAELTRPLVDLYVRRGLLAELDGAEEAAAVQTRIVNALVELIGTR